jgi:hypothetical protein
LGGGSGGVVRVGSEFALRGPLLEQGVGIEAGVVDVVEHGSEGGPGFVGEHVVDVDFAARVREGGAHPVRGLFGRERAAVYFAAVVVLRDDGGQAFEFGQGVAEGVGGRQFGTFPSEDGQQRALGGGGFAVAVEQITREGGGFVGVQDRLGVEVGVVAVHATGQGDERGFPGGRGGQEGAGDVDGHALLRWMVAA